MVKIEYNGRTFKSWKSYATALEKQFLKKSLSKQVKCPKCGRQGSKQTKNGVYYYVAHRIDGKRANCYIGKKWKTVDNGMPNAEDLELIEKK